ncbi:FLX-like 2 protein [Nymphaea thermarum]|nr:FLX-like 2 protein [Nymphaea thermarum]
MGSKGRMPPPLHMRRPLPGPGIVHTDSFGSQGVRPPTGPFPFDMLPPPEVMEQKLAVQHVEMQRLATENQRLAATHSVLRQELAAAQQELQRLQAHIGVIKADKEQQMRVLMEKISKMEMDLQSTDSVKSELLQARAEAQNLVTARQELISKAHQLTQDMQRSHAETQQIPALLAELDGLRKEYQHCRVAYDYEKKVYNEQFESLQVLEKNYVSMVREVEKLKAELANSSNHERSGGAYGSVAGYKESDVSSLHSAGQNAYGDGYGAAQQARGLPQPVVPSPGSAPARSSYESAVPYGGGPPIPSAPTHGGYDVPAGPVPGGPPLPASAPARGGYDVSRGVGSQVPGNVSSYGGSQPPLTLAGGYEVPRGSNAARR